MLHWVNALVGLPWWAAAVAKVTALLAVGWGLHLALLLVRASPRWRVMLWRGVMVGIPLVMLLTPALSWRLAVPRVPLPPFQMPELPPDYQPDLAPAPMVAAVAAAAEPPQAYEASHEPEPSPLPRVSFREWAADHAWMLIGILWLGVSAAFGAQMLIGLTRLRRLLARATPAPEPLQRLLGQVARSLGYRPGIRLLVSDSFSSPLLAELRIPTIVLPRRLLRLDRRSELAGILAHEVGHLPSRDVFWSLAARLLLLPLWFHPLAWRVRRAHGAACEQVCDVVAAEYVGDVRFYSSTLARAALELACPQALVGGIPMLGPSEIVHRLRLLSRGISAPRIGDGRLAAYAAVGLALAVALAGVRLVYAGTKPADSGMRVLEFPPDRSMGSLYAPTREAEEPEWQMLAGGEHPRDYVAEAQGRIKVPQNARVRLLLSGIGLRDLSPLSRLGPDDLQQLEFPTWEPALLDDRGLAHLRGLTGLRVLQVYHSVVTDRGLESLRGLKSLRRLQMRSDRITDRGPEALKDLESLRALAISSKQITDAGLARIAALAPLEILFVLSDRVTDAGVAQLAELKSLRCLSLWSRGVRGPGLAHLAKIPALERLVFAGGYAKAGYVTDESLRYVSNIRSLKALDVSYCPITDAGMQYVGQMSQLEELNLNGTKVTSASLEHVKRLRSLKCLPGPFGGVKLAALQQLHHQQDDAVSSYRCIRW